jgi:kynureninase
METDSTRIESLKLRAQELDKRDELAPFRDRFYVPPNTIYLDGNSLGLLSKPAEQAVMRVLEQWKCHAVDGWNVSQPPWFFLAEELGGWVAPLIGAAPDEAIVTNSTSVNLHQLIATLFRPDDRRCKILIDAQTFPSDCYVLASQLRLHGLDPATHLVRLRSNAHGLLDEDEIVAAMDSSIALIVLPAVVYTTGQLLDMRRLALEARDRGIVIGFDCSHSVGVVPHAFSEWGVDFAFWCSYKYLNGGPGAAGGLYLNRRHFGRSAGLAGWFGSRKDRQFDMAADIVAEEHAGAMQIGTPNILSMAPLLGSLPMILEAGIEAIRTKSLELTGILVELFDDCLGELGFELVNPRDENRRGGHIALKHEKAIQICFALRAQGIIPDFRPPDIVRLGPSPLYTRFIDCLEAIISLRQIVKERSYTHFPVERALVS